MPEKFLKHLEDQKGLYEICVEVGGNIYRIFCCFDKGKLVILFNGFPKKAQKTPSGELELALKLIAKMTQEQLADKIGAKKSFISRIESGQTDMQLSTLFRLLELGLGKKVELNVR